MTAVKAHNRSAMTQYLYGHSHVTKQELERELGLSLPTIHPKSARIRR